MTLFLALVISGLFFWLILDLHRERMSEKNRFSGEPSPSYFQVSRSYLKGVCKIEDEEELRTLVWFGQSILVLIAIVVSALIWILHLPLSAIAVTVLSLGLAIMLPRRALVFWNRRKSMKIDEEVNLAAILLMIRAKPDEMVDHVVYDVVDSMPKGKKGAFARSLLGSLGSFRISGQFIEAMETLKSTMEQPSVDRLSEAMSGWYGDVEHGNQYLDILVREQEAVRQFKLELDSGMNGLGAGFALVTVLLITTGLFFTQI